MLALKSSSQNSLSKEEFCNFYLALAYFFYQEKLNFRLGRPFRGHTPQINLLVARVFLYALAP